jgi:hypothetical protein
MLLVTTAVWISISGADALDTFSVELLLVSQAAVINRSPKKATIANGLFFLVFMIS